MLGAGGSDAALGTQLTAQALRNSAAAGIPLNVPANIPASPDVEVRLHGEQAPAPTLMDQAKSGWNTFAQKARLAWTAAQGKDPYAPDPKMLAGAQSLYQPGRDASSMIFRSGR
jgi:hypothetical protein